MNKTRVGPWLVLALAGAALRPAAPASADPPTPPAPPTEFRFNHTDVLGTSLELVVWTRNADSAKAVETRVLDEIERLRKLLSTYDPASEISRLNATTEAMACSTELLDVLASAEEWRKRSDGAFDVRLGQTIALWKLAERTGTPPTEAQLTMLSKLLAGPACEIDRDKSTARRLGLLALNVDALAKGYILDKAAAAGRGVEPPPAGLLLDIGGDMVLFGVGGPARVNPWRVSVVDPKRPGENEPPLTEIRLTNRAVATSGDDMRPFRVGGRNYSHILDPRTGQPASAVRQATAVARDATTADALATTLCVLTPADGLKLTRAVLGAECLIVAADGREYASAGWSALEPPDAHRPAPPAGGDEPRPADGGAWPAGFRLNIDLTLADPSRGRRRANRPYLAVWIEDAGGKPVRTVTVWGDDPEYLRELSTWWSFAKRDRGMVRSVTRASRPAGQYLIVWDGADDSGKSLSQGTYTVHMEVNREKGRHIRDMAGRIDCRDQPASGSIAPNTEVQDVKLTYGPRG